MSIATYLILKLTFQAILEESNRLAAEAETSEKARWLKSKVVQLDIDFSTGVIDEEEYGKQQGEIMEELRKLSERTRRPLILDIDGLLAEFEDALLVALKALDDGDVIRVNKVSVDGPLKITTNISARVGLLEGLEPSRVLERPPRQEPLIEVVDDKRGLRAMALFPGIRKEDVKVYPLKRSLRIEVSNDGSVHRRDIPCDASPSSIEVRSISLNNSVVEIWFSRKKKEASA